MSERPPLCLAIEVSQTAGSVAILGEFVRLEVALDRSARSARTLVPTIQQLLRRAGCRPADVGLLAVTLGPGSFTSLRVGIVTAKTLAYALSADVLGLGSLEVIAAQAPRAPRLATAIDAGRGQVYAARFDTTAPLAPRALEPVQLVDLTAWLDGLTAADRVSGPILRTADLALPPGVRTTDPVTWDPSAATLAALALRQHEAGRRDDLWRLAPIYVRPSAAEERRPRPEAH